MSFKQLNDFVKCLGVELISADHVHPRNYLSNSIFLNEILITLIRLGDGFRNQSYSMVHLLTLANVLVRMRYKNKRIFLFSIYFNNEPRTFSNVQVPPNNLTMFLRYDKMFVILFTSARDDDRYVTVLKSNETTTGSYVFIFGTAQDDISCNCTRRRSVLSQEINAQQVFKHFRRNESVPSNVTRIHLETLILDYFNFYFLSINFMSHSNFNQNLQFLQTIRNFT